MHFLIETISQVEWQQVVMWLIGGTLIFLAIKKDMEPALLLPMGFGAILVNIPGSAVIADDGILSSLFKVGIEASEAMPILLFIGIGAMIDFGPLLSNPKLFILGGSAQLGIFLTLILAALIGFSLPNAAAIAIIGGADGPTAIFVTGFYDAQTLWGMAVKVFSNVVVVVLNYVFSKLIIFKRK